ncbi:MAG: hypothetical protein U0T77_10560 [Chitinophagales bacterium]
MENYLRSAQIIVTRTQDKYQTRVIDCKSELEAQNQFDANTENAKGSNEHEGYLRWDLVVVTESGARLIRRTMYTAE